MSKFIAGILIGLWLSLLISAIWNHFEDPYIPDLITASAFVFVGTAICASAGDWGK